VQARRNDRQERLNRIGRRGVPELIAAVEHARLGLKTADRISRLSKKEQRFQLTGRLEAQALNQQRQLEWRKAPFKRGKSLYASSSYAETKERRLRRAGRYAVRELTDAFNAGNLSLRQYELMSRLSPARQKKTLQLDRHRKEGQQLAARVIHLLLARTRERIDLTAIETEIIASIRGARVPAGNPTTARAQRVSTAGAWL
jgi:hypothetical protein